MGTGFGYDIIGPALFNNQLYQLNAFYSRNGKLAKEAKKNLGARAYYDDWQRCIDESKSSLIVIATPTYTHFEIARYALKADKHVALTAPVAMRSEEVEKLSRLALDRDRVGLVLHHYNYLPARRYTVSLIKSGKIGVLRSIERTYRSFNRYRFEVEHSWKFNEKSGGGLMNSLGSHDVDFLLRIAGGVDKVFAQKETTLKNRQQKDGELYPCTADDLYHMNLNFHKGATALIKSSAVTPGRTSDEFIFYGSEGVLTLNNNNELSYYDKNGNKSRLAIPPNYQVTNLPGNKDITPVYAMFEAMAGAIHNGTPISPTLDEALHIQRVIDAANQSHANGSWVEVGSEAPKVPDRTGASQPVDKIYE